MLRSLKQYIKVAGLFLFAGLWSAAGVDGVVTNALSNSEDSNPKNALTLRWENDVIGGTDENYSNGISLSLVRRGRGLFGRVWDLFGVEDAEYFHSYEAGQIMNTPSDTTRTDPDPNDRPYSGLLYLGLATQIRKGNDFHGLKFVTGVVGPASLAKETQIWFHRIIGSHRPMGWHHQLRNEPIFNFVYEYRHKYKLFDTESGYSSELIPVAGVMAGNILCQGQLGLQSRIGWHIPDDFGTTLLRGMGNLTLPKYKETGKYNRAGFYLFGGGGFRAVGRDLQLEGNTFRDSPGVSIRNFVLSGEIGMSVYYKAIQVTASYVVNGREFDFQRRTSDYGALAITVFF
ncbi:MAG: lipid A deacylase LpxR family protein [Verrucomicrobiia bacterium]